MRLWIFQKSNKTLHYAQFQMTNKTIIHVYNILQFTRRMESNPNHRIDENKTIKTTT